MCIIIDANKLGQFLSQPPDADSAPIHNWLENKGGKIVYSTAGRFRAEIGRKARERLRVYFQAGMAVEVDEERFGEDQRQLAAIIRSDDPHVLAMARATNTRILYTADQDLISDFKNKELIDQPRGKIYTNAANSKLLTKSACST